MIVVGIDPGATTGWVVYDAETRHVLASGQFPEHHVSRCLRELVVPCGIDAVTVIERPKGQGPTRPQVVECGITFGRLAAWAESNGSRPVHELLRYEVKSILSAATHGEVNARNDASVWAALVLLHGEGSDKKAKTRKGVIVEPAGCIGGVKSHERAALAVAVAWTLRGAQ